MVKPQLMLGELREHHKNLLEIWRPGTPHGRLRRHAEPHVVELKPVAQAKRSKL
jgi:hypothetical protein